MKKGRILHWSALLLCTVLFWLMPAVPVSAGAAMPIELLSAPKIVRVAFPQQVGLSWTDEDGKRSGYTYDYLQEIAQYTGWEYEFIEVPGDINQALTTMLDMLAKGELDVMGGLVRNDYTEAQFDLPEYGYGYSYTTLSVPEEITDISENNYTTQPQLRVAAIEGGERNKEALKSFCEQNQIYYTLVECATTREVMQAVEKGRADVALGGDLAPYTGFRTIAQFNGSQFHFAVTKGNTELLNAFNRTILTIRQVKPQFDAMLNEKYFLKRSGTLYLSDVEKDFVEKAGTIRVAMVSTLAPLQYTTQDGKPQGIAKAVLDRVSEMSGLQFEYLSADGYQAAFDMLDRGEAEMICAIPYDYELAQKQGLVMSNQFLSAPLVQVIKNGVPENLAGKKVAVVAQGLVNTAALEAERTTFDNVAQCFDAVMAGQVDGAFVNLYSAEHFGHFDKYSSLRLIPIADYTLDFCFGIKKPFDTNLVSIINGAIRNLPQSELSSLIYQSNGNEGEQLTLSSFVRGNPFMALGILSAFFLVLGLAGAAFVRIRMRAERALNLENQRYLRLSELANEYIYEYDCRSGNMIFSREFSKKFALPDKIQDFGNMIAGNVRLPEGINPDVFALFKKLFPAGDGAEQEHTCRMPDGQLRWYRAIKAEVRDTEDKPIYFIGKFTDVQEEKDEKDQLEQQILLDGLTGIYNAVAAKRLIGQRLAELHKPAAMLIIDIDKFKEVNDRLGHYSGDVALKEFAYVLRGSTAKWDVVGRLGGDEFIVYVESAGSYEATEALCAMLCARARKVHRNEDGATCQITISIGAAVVGRPCDFDQLYQAVDKELYTSKKTGRDRYTLIQYDQESAE